MAPRRLDDGQVIIDGQLQGQKGTHAAVDSMAHTIDGSDAIGSQPSFASPNYRPGGYDTSRGLGESKAEARLPSQREAASITVSWGAAERTWNNRQAHFLQKKTRKSSKGAEANPKARARGAPAKSTLNASDYMERPCLNL